MSYGDGVFELGVEVVVFGEYGLVIVEDLGLVVIDVHYGFDGEDYVVV